MNPLLAPTRRRLLAAWAGVRLHRAAAAAATTATATATAAWCASLAQAPGRVQAAPPEPVRVAVAANFAATLQSLAALFEQASGYTLAVAVGSTGQFDAQIRNGAPFDVLLAADAETPERLAQQGLADARTRFTYARGALVLWRPEPGPLNEQTLRAGRFQRLALANPRLAPYGAAAQQALTHLGLWAQLQPQLVQGENIGQTYQFVASGNASLGFVALAQVSAPGRAAPGAVWRVPTDWYRPLWQDAVLLRPGYGKPGPQALLQFLQSERARTLIRAYGYDI